MSSLPLVTQSRHAALEQFGSGLRASVRKKELLSIDLIGGNCGLSLATGEPINKGLAFSLFYVGMSVRIDQYDAILIEKLGISFDQDCLGGLSIPIPRRTLADEIPRYCENLHAEGVNDST